MNVLFLCTGNSARSLIAEAVLNARYQGIHRAFSAGSRPAGEPHPVAIRTLEAAGYVTANLRSKSWDEYSVEGAVLLDVVITLCDGAAAGPAPAPRPSPRRSTRRPRPRRSPEGRSRTSSRASTRPSTRCFAARTRRGSPWPSSKRTGSSSSRSTGRFVQTRS